jgi:hypothetical protein
MKNKVLIVNAFVAGDNEKYRVHIDVWYFAS